jgi:hypothetical protein
MIERGEFVADVSAAVSAGGPYATGKLGFTEQTLLSYPLLLERNPGARQIRAFEISLKAQALPHAGLFPAEESFYRRFSLRMAEDVRRLDCLGLSGPLSPNEVEVVRGHRYDGKLTYFLNQEPDRGNPADDSRCYLPSFRGRRLLLVCPFAGLLRDRADRETFEAVWASTGKRWFEPASVEAVEFPYGYEPATQERYGTAERLLDEITGRIAAADFDVALIAAGMLGIPIAAFVKSLGAVGISLGGHLQIVFGVYGERWLKDPGYRGYFNDAWIRVPPEMAPDPSTTREDYW